MKYKMLIVFLLCPFTTFAAGRLSCKDAEKIVKRYIELDESGETLSPSKKIDELIDARESTFTPPEDIAVSKYARVINCEKINDRFKVEVISEIYGSLTTAISEEELNEFIVRPSQKEGQKIFVNNVKGLLKIDPTTLLKPHVSVESVRKIIHIKMAITDCYRNYFKASALEDPDNKEKAITKWKALCLSSGFTGGTGQSGDPLLMTEGILSSWKTDAKVSIVALKDSVAKLVLGKDKEENCLQIKLNAENTKFKIFSVQKCSL